MAPKIETSVAASPSGYAVTLRSPVLARSVYLSFSDLDVQTSDNYFDLLPGETVTVNLKTSSALSQVQSALQVVSLTNAFPDADTMR
jgi:beta-mannosidase